MSNVKPSNVDEVKELRNEGGSDVFTSTRHVNPNAVSFKTFHYLSLLHLDA